MSIHAILSSAFTAAWSAVWTPRCPLCGEVTEEPDVFCPGCLLYMTPVVPPFCLICGAELDPEAAPADRVCGRCKLEPPAFTEARAFGRYGESLAEAVRGFKFRSRRLLLPAVNGLLARADREHFGEAIFDAVVPVPLHRDRVTERGFNQAADLARAVARRRGIPLLQSALVRRKDTLPQYGLNLKERRRNVEGAFKVTRAEQVRGRRILLIDDVMTTGATVNECARVLLKAKANEVCVLTLARAV